MPLLAVPNATAHPSTASVPITVLLYDDPLLYSFNVPIKGLVHRPRRTTGPTAKSRLVRIWVRWPNLGPPDEHLYAFNMLTALRISHEAT